MNNLHPPSAKIVVATGFLSNFFIEAGAQIFPVELLFTLHFAVTLGTALRSFQLNTHLSTFTWIAAAYCVAQFLTDVIRQTPLEDALRGNLAAISILIVPIQLSVFFRFNPRAAMLAFLGLQAGGIFRVLLFPNEVEADNSWKFGLGIPICYFVIYFISRGTGKDKSSVFGRTAASMIALGLTSMMLNARSLGGVLIASGTLLLLIASSASQSARILKGLDSPLGVLGAVAFTLTFMIFGTYAASELAKTGLIGTEAREKYESQSSGVYGSLGVLIASRGDFLFAAKAIADSPIIGHGSWAKDKRYRETYWEIYDLGYMEDSEERVIANIQSSDRIPAHSQLLTGWIWAGIFGALFWMYLIRLIFVGMHTVLTRFPEYLPMITVVGVLSLWHIFFSPFGSSHRIQWEYVLALIFCLIFNPKSTDNLQKS